MAKHSPGPWEVFQSGRDEALYVASKQGNVVAFIGPEDEDENADLIAAAPDLFQSSVQFMAAIEDAYPIVGKDDDYIYDTVGSLMASAYFKARAAIAKATGETDG